MTSSNALTLLLAERERRRRAKERSTPKWRDIARPNQIAPDGDWQTWVVGKLQIGKVLGATVDFLIIALVVFLVLVKGLSALSRKKEEEAPAAPATKDCPQCLEPVPAAARRCKHCTSELA